MHLAVAHDCSAHPGKVEEHGLIATNAAHPSLHRYIIWMILALPKFASDHANLRRDVMAWEMHAEMVKAKEIMARLKNGLGVTNIAAKLCEAWSWSDPGPVFEHDRTRYCACQTMFDHCLNTIKHGIGHVLIYQCPDNEGGIITWVITG
ncbi:hypothetical protein EDD15DRAFT_2194469 [Pisolithus albus]|nr:hypothetical protein EDD15DRAFT_2194469 [Pisolithus albus]